MRKNYFKTFIIGMIMLTMLGAGCTKKGMYHVVVKNDGTKELNNVTLSYDKFEHNFGILIPKADKGYTFAGDLHPLPNEATLEWQTSDKKWHKQIVKVKSVILKNYKDIDIYFNIDDNNRVTVTYEDKAKRPWSK
jgi:hypothetical protein